MRKDEKNERKTQLLKQFLATDTKKTTTSAVLVAIAVVGFVVVASALPGLPLVLAPFIGKRHYKGRRVYDAYRSLERSGYVKTKRLHGGKQKIELTKKGRRRTEVIVLDAVSIQKPRSWDNKWRFIIFDIPKEKAKVRDGFRFKLQDLGLRQYQDSVWIYPYPCEEEIMLTAEFFGLREHLDILLVETFIGARKMRQYFKC